MNNQQQERNHDSGVIRRKNPPPKAGFIRPNQQIIDGTTAECLSFPPRPKTPEKIGKFRKSYFSAPGQRIIHSGMIEDSKKIDRFKKFGETMHQSDHISDVTSNRLPTDHELITAAKTEALYASSKREPLGKAYTRGHVFPPSVNSSFAFGIKSETSQSSTESLAKDLMYPFNENDDAIYKEMYKKSHGHSDPGVQLNRSYTSAFPGTSHVFGVKGSSNITGGVQKCLQEGIGPDAFIPSRIVAKSVEDRKSLGDELGKVRITGQVRQPDGHVFGVAGNASEASARECIAGDYGSEAPDADLGRAVNSGWRNVTTEVRPFGVPSVRADIVAPERRSVADNQNYGDDVDAQFLLYPDTFASNGVEDGEFASCRSFDEIKALFQKIGYDLDDATFVSLYNKAASEERLTAIGHVSIEEFRNTLNEYLDSQ